ncbi:MAG TPA: aminotransferase class I/II-fold pyridoxal phosphate-dependent enzyme [Dongiaceae bacterium]|nr:aminotransferase class I/II-fold pyridoxal phosphate-dependent enzyme [Dongiaceae bacterium]
MTATHLTPRAMNILETISPIRKFFTESTWARRASEPGMCDFTIGNPNEMPPHSYIETLKHWIEPRDPHWFAYTMNEPSARRAVAESLRKWRGVVFEEEDIFMTNGLTGGLVVVIGAIVEPGDEVIFVSPPWFLYEGMIIAAGGVPVREKIDLDTYDLDLASIERSITARTRAIIINSPHNPTGRIYPPETLQALADILEKASGKNGRPIYLISDESYSRIVFDKRVYPSPTSFYPNSFLVYTYTKVLLAPGERLGYIALPPEMPRREEMRSIIFAFQMLSGWAFPDALLQHALGDLEQISIDLEHLQSKRDRLVASLRDMGYETNLPEGTFYILVRSPIAEDHLFAEMLSEYDIFCMPGSALELPGYFRLSITASDEMIDRALPGFAAALKRAGEIKRQNDAE